LEQGNHGPLKPGDITVKDNQTKRKMKRAHSSDILKRNRKRKKNTFIKANSFKAASRERYSQLKLLRCLR
jgi:hypothetical protein